jgi:Mg-chelatase subunit ChlI
MTASLTVLDSPAVRDLRVRVFRQRELSLVEAAAPYAIHDWQATLRSLRAQTCAALDALPERAFEPQPASAGSEVWSAGQVVGHILMAQVDIFGKDARSIAGASVDYTASELAGLPSDAHRSRSEAVRAIERADEALTRLFEELPRDVDITAAVPNEHFGTASIGALLLMIAIHEEDHCGQLRELGAQG